MFAIAFDVVVAETRLHHPLSVAAAYQDIGRVLGTHGFARVQGSVYICPDENLADLFCGVDSVESARLVPEVRSRYPGVPGRTVERFYGFHEIVNDDDEAIPPCAGSTAGVLAMAPLWCHSGD